MTERKFNEYTLWLKWQNKGWTKAITCLNLPWPAENPRDVLFEWVKTNYVTHWDEKNWVILGGDKKPSGHNL